ncbi:MAG: acyl-CoA thioesterase/BAAT N-terminal domain-containing protein [Gemmatales bacterium]
MLRIELFAVSLLCFQCVAMVFAQAPSEAAIQVEKSIVDGFPPGIRLTGLAANETVRLHAFRSLEKWQNDKGQWKRMPQLLHAWVEFKASSEGKVEVDQAVPLKGTYLQADPLGLLRTGYRWGDVALKDAMSFQRESFNSAASDRVYLKLERNGRIIQETSFQLRDCAAGVVFEEVTGDGWQGIYARPGDRSNLPLLVSLHGSEGEARQRQGLGLLSSLLRVWRCWL